MDREVGEMKESTKIGYIIKVYTPVEPEEEPFVYTSHREVLEDLVELEALQPGNFYTVLKVPLD